LLNDLAFRHINEYFQIQQGKKQEHRVINIIGSPGDKEEYRMWTSETNHYEINDVYIKYDLFNYKEIVVRQFGLLQPNGIGLLVFIHVNMVRAMQQFS
jgi:hypothetical protein